jgi:Rrf2 family nitric oxide-sensitive transcriptional repressor
MRLNTFTDYALRVLIHVAARPGERSTIAEIATAFAISEHHLTKVVHFLGREGFLRNVRGRGGGLELARTPEHIGVGAVVRATEGAALPAECFDADAGGCVITRVCRLRHVLHDALEAFYGVLDRYTLADLVHNRATLARVLFVAMPATAAPAGRRRR